MINSAFLILIVLKYLHSVNTQSVCSNATVATGTFNSGAYTLSWTSIDNSIDFIFQLVYQQDAKEKL